MLVTGGLGGLGLISSFHCASEFENPIFTTSRSGRLGSSAPHAMNMMEAIKEMVPVFNVRLDVGKSHDMPDFMTWICRPGLPPEDRSMMIDDILAGLQYKMDKMPNDALKLIQEFLLEVKDKIYEVMIDLKSKETKIDPSIFRELTEKERYVSEAIAKLRGKVGMVERSGRVQLSGGVAPGAYSVPDADAAAPALGNQSHGVSQDALLEMLEEEMQKDPSYTAEAPKADTALPPGAWAHLAQEQRN
jgi:hypothetical protein